MPNIYLHHYAASPFSEKVRALLGYLDLEWHSVETTIIMPRPLLMPLSGGYRRIPVAQIGADVYCDTKMCARALERRHPEPSLFPGGDEALVWGLSRWAETSFMMGVTVFLGAGGLFDEAFVEDRKKMVPDVDFSQAGALVPAKLLQLRANLDLLERQLADGREFLLGARCPPQKAGTQLTQHLGDPRRPFGTTGGKGHVAYLELQHRDGCCRPVLGEQPAHPGRNPR